MKINANDQLDLKGSCLKGCNANDTIVYSYELSFLNNTTNQWSLFTNNSYFYVTGKVLSDLTIKKELFSDFPTQIIWKINFIINDINLLLIQTQASSSIIFYVNHPPLSGSCDINPKNGTTSTLFYIYCSKWVDSNGVSASNYVFYGEYFLNFHLKFFIPGINGIGSYI